MSCCPFSWFNPFLESRTQEFQIDDSWNFFTVEANLRAVPNAKNVDNLNELIATVNDYALKISAIGKESRNQCQENCLVNLFPKLKSLAKLQLEKIDCQILSTKQIQILKNIQAEKKIGKSSECALHARKTLTNWENKILNFSGQIKDLHKSKDLLRMRLQLLDAYYVLADEHWNAKMELATEVSPPGDNLINWNLETDLYVDKIAEARGIFPCYPLSEIGEILSKIRELQTECQRSLNVIEVELKILTPYRDLLIGCRAEIVELSKKLDQSLSASTHTRGKVELADFNSRQFIDQGGYVRMLKA